jgi:hypothetical protein
MHKNLAQIGRTWIASSLLHSVISPNAIHPLLQCNTTTNCSPITLQATPASLISCFLTRLDPPSQAPCTSVQTPVHPEPRPYQYFNSSDGTITLNSPSLQTPATPSHKQHPNPLAPLFIPQSTPANASTTTSPLLQQQLSCQISGQLHQLSLQREMTILRKW